MRREGKTVGTLVCAMVSAPTPTVPALPASFVPSLVSLGHFVPLAFVPSYPRMTGTSSSNSDSCCCCCRHRCRRRTRTGRGARRVVTPAVGGCWCCAARVQHGYGNTRGVQAAGCAGTGAVCDFPTRGYTVPVTAVPRVCTVFNIYN